MINANDVKSCSALDAANFLIFLMKGTCDDLSNMKLNKLLYYAQGHYLKMYGVPLFKEKIYAWTHGPLIKEVYGMYKDYGDHAIENCDDSKALALDDNIKSFLLDIARVYGRFTASALRNMTHKPHSPWDQTAEGHEIPLSVIEMYFESCEQPIGFVTIDFDENSFIGYHDDSGVFVLPEDWRDEEI